MWGVTIIVWGGSDVCVQVIVVVVGMNKGDVCVLLSLKQTATHNKADPAFELHNDKFGHKLCYVVFQNTMEMRCHISETRTQIASISHRDHGRPVTSYNLNPTVLMETYTS